MKTKIAVLVLSSVLALGLGAVGQADLSLFPLGATTMVFHVTTEDLSAPQVLELQVIVHADRTYSLRMVTEARGTAEQLSAFGFLFGAMGFMHGAGEGVGLAPLQALMDQRGRLQEGEEYLLPGGGTFTNVVGTTIAGVLSIEGSFVDPRNPNTRTTVAFGLSHPVYTVPRVRVERLRAGRWETVFSMELVEYRFAGG